MKQLFVLFLLTGQLALAQTSANRPVLSGDTLRKIQLNDLVITASRVPERLLKSPVSIELLDARQIRLSAQPSYFEAIENLRGVQLLT
ncbi:MAG: TonB-dependent receptor, partial [Cytophagaceae bacterium]